MALGTMKHVRLKISLFLTYVVFAILLNSVGSAILQVQNSFNATEREASLLEVFEDSSLAVVSLVASPYIVRFSYKSSMLTALSVVALACVVAPLLRSFWATNILFVVIGATFAVTKMAVFGMLGLIVETEEEHVSLMNFLEAFFMVGIVSSYFLVSFFLDANDISSSSWLYVFFVVAALAAVVVLIVACTPFDEGQLAGTDVSLLSMMRKMWNLLRQPLVLVYTANVFLYLLIEQSFMSWLPSYNAKVLNMSPSLSIQMSSILAGATAIGRFAAGLVMMKLRWNYVLMTCLVSAIIVILIAIPFGKNHTEMISHLSEVPVVAFAFPLIGLFLAPLYPALNSLILTTLPVAQHSIMGGLIVIFSALGGAAGSFLTGNLFQSLGGKDAFYVMIGPIVLMLLAVLAFKYLLDRPRHEEPVELQEMVSKDVPGSDSAITSVDSEVSVNFEDGENIEPVRVSSQHKIQ